MKAASPKISVIIVAYNMAREIPRTVYSFLPPFQRNIAMEDVEIIVLENGSTARVPAEIVETWPPNVHYMAPDKIFASPAYALNFGVAQAGGEFVCPVIDGARMASPGLLSNGLAAAAISDRAFIATVGLHLGDKPQQLAVSDGYDQEREDALLARIDWQNNGYALFDISCFGRSADTGWFGPVAESNAPILRRDHYERMGGYDTSFTIPGGGLVNLDFFRRGVEDPESVFITLLGEGTFHQYHGGVTTSKPVRQAAPELGGKSAWDVYVEEYQSIRGEEWRIPRVVPILFGRPVGTGKRPVLACIRRALDRALA